MENFLKQFFFSSRMKGLVGLYGISGKKWLKPTFFVHDFQTIHWIFYETWPNVSKYGFLWLYVGLYACMLMFVWQFLFWTKSMFWKWIKWVWVVTIFHHFRLFEAISSKPFVGLLWNLTKTCIVWNVFVFLLEAGDHR